jgi:hypothetical protein
LIGLLIAGFVLRLALSPYGGFGEDLAVMRYWATRLALVPLGDFYAAQGVADHLPGDLWLLWYLANAFRAFSPEMRADGTLFLVLIKLVPSLADVGIGLVLYLLGRDLSGAAIGRRAAAFYLFNPAPIFLASIWGQWDAVSAFCVLLALWLTVRGRIQWALPVMAYALLIKPQFAVLVPLAGLAYLRSELLPAWHRARGSSGWVVIERLWRPVGRVVAGAVLAVVVATLVALPFGVGLPLMDTRWSLVDRFEVAWRTHNRTSLNAFTLWATPLAGNGQVDDRSALFGLGARTWSQLLLAIAVVAILVRYWRWGGQRALVWGWLATLLALYVLPTRVHERYLLPAVVVAALVAALSTRLSWLYAGLSALYFAGLVAVYALAHRAGPGPAPLFAADNPWVIAASMLNVALLLFVLTRALPYLVADATVRGGPPRVRGAPRRGDRKR